MHRVFAVGIVSGLALLGVVFELSIDQVVTGLTLFLAAVLAYLRFIAPVIERAGRKAPLYRLFVEVDESEVSTVSQTDYVEPPRNTSQTNQTDTADTGLSAGLSALSGLRGEAVADIMLYSDMTAHERAQVTTRADLVAALVALGWRTGEIRKLLSGDSGVIGEEVKAAQKQLGLESDDGRTPITVGRGPNMYEVQR